MTKEEFKLCRKRLGFTQAEFARELGYARTITISDKETGRATISKRDEIIIEKLMQQKLENKLDRLQTKI